MRTQPLTESSRWKSYKCRAECLLDVAKLRQATEIPIDHVHIECHDYLPDVGVSFRSIASLAAIQDWLSHMEDCPVMAETVNYADQYTGERKSVPPANHAKAVIKQIRRLVRKHGDLPVMMFSAGKEVPYGSAVYQQANADIDEQARIVVFATKKAK